MAKHRGKAFWARHVDALERLPTTKDRDIDSLPPHRDGENDLPMTLRQRMAELLEVIAGQSAAMAWIESDVAEFAARDVRSQRFQPSPASV